MIEVRTSTYAYTFPAQGEPVWKEKVDRWYQLDAAAFGLADAAHYWKQSGSPSRPDFVLLASHGASNDSDAKFAREGASSPSKFVHTLPNIRATAFCQVSAWSGPLLCLQKDPGTIVAALTEASEFVSPQYPTVWILGVNSLGSGKWEAYRFELKLNEAQKTPRTLTLEPGEATTDEALWQRISESIGNREGTFQLDNPSLSL